MRLLYIVLGLVGLAALATAAYGRESWSEATVSQLNAQCVAGLAGTPRVGRVCSCLADGLQQKDITEAEVRAYFFNPAPMPSDAKVEAAANQVLQQCVRAVVNESLTI